MKNGRVFRFWMGLCLALLSACKFESSATPTTQLVVDVDAEPLIRMRLTELKVLVAGAPHRDYLDERMTVLEQSILPSAAPEGFAWPVRLVMEPKQGDARRVFELSVTAVDNDGMLVAEGRLITGYVSHEIRYARLVLEDACYKTRCSELDTCREGGCTDAFVEPTDLPLLPPPDAGVDAGEAGAPDTGAPPEPDSGMDAGLDSGMDSSTPPDSGPPPIDPCLKNNGGCDLLVDCLSVDGVPTCGQCPTGFVDVNADGARCEDIDECAKNKGGCDKDHGICTNTPGGNDCACEPGYNGNGRECSVNVPCGENPAVCDTLASCQEIAGRKVCQCNAGYEGNGGTCTDINECQRKLDNCVTHSTCTNSEGSFTCTCNKGYMLVGGACVDIDECLLNMDDCDSTPDACINVDGTFTCQCPKGYTGSGTGDTCQDDNECTLNTDNCDNSPDACQNTVGSFMCVCPAGYLGTGVGGNGCIEIDECQLQVDTCDSMPDACVNDIGGTPGYHCACPAGYSGNGQGQNGCVDIDECAMNMDDCDDMPNACVNDVGVPVSATRGYHCTCPMGYTGNGVGTNGCVDVNECAPGGGATCNANADCANAAGGYTCMCRAGFTQVGDGRGAGGCTDKDECAPGGGATCNANADCANTSGGYTCTCRAGYTQVGDGRGTGGCTDTNECAPGGGATCNANADCANTAGSYTCTCRAGYTQVGDGRGTGGCTDKDECAPGGGSTCNANATCANTAGSYTCTCKSGYTQVGDGRGTGGCTDTNECAAGGGADCNANADCTNVPAGSYTCTCKAGYSGTGHGATGCTDTNSCAPNPCQNGGACTDNPPGAATPYTCACVCGFSGAECQTVPTQSTVGPVNFTPQGSEAIAADTILAVPISIGATARTLVGIGVGGATGTANVHLGVYSDASNSPSTLLYQSGDVALPSTIISVNPCVALAANSTVWIAIQGSAAFSVANDGSGTNITRYSLGQAFASKLPSAWPTPMANSGPNLALYLVTAP